VRFVSLLRGINVSGQKKIKMADLKALYQSLGFKNVVTYIQSGNVIFNSPSEDLVSLIDIIEKEIEDKYEFHVPVILRTEQEFQWISNSCPYKEAEIEENGTKILVTFLASTPSLEKQELLETHVALPEKLTIKGNEVYLYCPNGYGRSKISNTVIENKLGVTATTRNWKSITKLSALSCE